MAAAAAAAAAVAKAPTPPPKVECECPTVTVAAPAPAPAVVGAKDWALRIAESQFRKYSEGTQDGTLEYIFSNIGTKHSPPFFVEFGFDMNTYEESHANTRNMHEKGWRGVLLDGSHENSAINLHKRWVAADTIVQTLTDLGVPDEADYVSVDIDSADAWVFRAIVSSHLRPRVLTVEYNCNYPAEATLCNIGGSYQWAAHHDRLFGTSLGALHLIGQEFGYTIVHLVRCLDAVFVRNDLLTNTAVRGFEGVVADVPGVGAMARMPIHNPVSAGNQADIDKFLCDYAVWAKTKSMEACQGAAVRKQIKDLNIQL